MKKWMPHVIVKVSPGKTEQQKARLAEAITRDVMDIFASEEAVVSVSIEEVAPDHWEDDVYRADVKGH